MLIYTRETNQVYLRFKLTTVRMSHKRAQIPFPSAHIMVFTNQTAKNDQMSNWNRLVLILKSVLALKHYYKARQTSLNNVNKSNSFTRNFSWQTAALRCPKMTKQRSMCSLFSSLHFVFSSFLRVFLVFSSFVPNFQ